MGFCFQVVSSAYSMSEVLSAILAFVEAVPGYVRGGSKGKPVSAYPSLPPLSKEEYQDHIEAYIQDRLVPDTSLSAAAAHNWEEISERRFDFGSREACAVAAGEIWGKGKGGGGEGGKGKGKSKGKNGGGGGGGAGGSDEKAGRELLADFAEGLFGRETRRVLCVQVSGGWQHSQTGAGSGTGIEVGASTAGAAAAAAAGVDCAESPRSAQAQAQAQANVVLFSQCEGRPPLQQQQQQQQQEEAVVSTSRAVHALCGLWTPR